MRAIKLPISFTNGRLSTTSDIDRVVKQKIVDVLTTSNGERVMNPRYGAGAYGLLYEPIDPLVFEDFKVEATQEIAERVSGIQITDLQMIEGDPYGMTNSSDSTVTMSVSYRIPPLEASSVSFSISEFN